MCSVTFSDENNTVMHELDERSRNPGFFSSLVNVWKYPQPTICLMKNVNSRLLRDTVKYELVSRARNPGL